MKKCTKCQIEKDESEFSKDKSKENGLCHSCKECVRIYNIQYRIKNKDKLRQKGKEYFEIHKDEKREYDKEYRQKNKDKIRERKKEYAARPENKKKRNRKDKERCQTDSCYKLKRCISIAVGNGLKKNCGSKRGSSILSKLPYSMQELKQHIESLFDPWMNWENHGKYNSNRRTWQIDHIKPHSSFHYDNMDCEEFRQCWALSNLRPLESLANIKKGNKIG